MKIKVSKENAKKIEQALHEVNCRATAHAYTTFDEIEEITKRGENLLNRLLYKKDYAKAIYTSTSGDSVANAYNYSRNATEAVLLRTKTAWFLMGLKRVPIYTSPGKEWLRLTKAQDEAAKSKLSEKYSVIN